MSDTIVARSGAGSRWPILILTLGFLIVLAVGAATAWMVGDAREQNKRVEHTMDVRAVADALFIALLNAETGQRGFLLTGGANYRGVYEKGSAEAPVALRQLREMTLDNPRQQETLARIEPIARARLAIAAQTVAQAAQGRTDEALDLVRSGRGKALMDRLRVEIDGVQAEESRLLDERRVQADETGQILLILSVAGLVLAGAMAVGAILSMLRYARGLEGANREVRQLNEGLEEIVTERTADLQAANDEIQRFAYIVSHDLRSPLVNVMGFTAELDAAGGQARDLLAKAEAQAPAIVSKDHRLAIIEDLPEALSFIRTSTAKMDRLINAILKLSREGRRSLTPERIETTKMVEEIADALQQQVEAASARIDIAPLPPLVGDRLALEQILSNLVENAVKYLSPDRPGVIAVRGASHGPLVDIMVEDNGRGIDKADHERVFELFRRAGAQDKPGEGIGLAHVRALARRLGGNITLDSEPGRGSRFTLTVPREVKGTAG